MRVRALALIPILAAGLAVQAPPQEKVHKGVLIDTSVDHISSNDMRTALATMEPDSRGVIFRASSDGQAQYILNRRTNESEVESHDAWDDYFVVQNGRGSVHYGGRLRNAKELNRGELRGGELTGARQVAIRAGDMLRVPAGIPHLVRPDGDAPLIYLVFKVRRRGGFR